MTTYLLFAVAAVILVALVGLIWRIWNDYAERSPEDEERERELAELNDAQANRISDQHLTRPVDPDTAWRTMVQRGGEPRRKRRPSRRPPR